MGTHLQALLHR
jgi:hypothetical protein